MNCAVLSDSYIISHLVTSTLNPHGYICEKIRLKKLDVRKRNLQRFSIVIVNSTKSLVGGIDITKEIRLLHSDLLILAITTKGDWKSKVKYLEEGADDVLNYPFPMQELSSRVGNLFSRPKDKLTRKYNIGDARLDTNLKAVYLNDKMVDMRKKEYRIIEYLAQNSQRAVTRSELLDNIWDYRKVTGSNTIDVHVSNIRKRFGTKGIIKTIHGFGYKISDECVGANEEEESPTNASA